VGAITSHRTGPVTGGAAAEIEHDKRS
jgi:hypothetical protein